MATGSRTLKLSILADVDQLNKSLKAANSDVEDSSSKMLDFGKKAGLAFAAAAAAAGAYAIKIGVDGVKAAIEDEQSQSKLALALQRATGATNEQISATEAQILKMSLATGVADDKLRPALSRLAISTGDISKAQDLLSLSLDVATQTGKPLETVANAIGKAYDGNTAALGKLGIGLSSTQLKTMDFTQVQQRLTDLFGGAAAKNAETFQGRMDVLKTTINEAKETIGYALLPILEKLVGYFTEYVVPIVEKLSNSFGSKTSGLSGYITDLGNTITAVFVPIWNGLVKAFNSVKGAVEDNFAAFSELGGYIQKYLAPIIGTVLGGAFEIVGKIASGVITVVGGVVRAINAVIGVAIDGINALIKAYNAIPLLPNIPLVSKPTLTTPTITAPSVPSVSTKLPTISTPSGVSGSTVSGTTATTAAAATIADIAAAAGGTNGVAGAGTTDAQNWARITEIAAVAGATAASVNTNTLAGIMAASGTTVNLTVNGAIDPESTARTIVTTLNDSAWRGTGGASNLVAV